MSVWDGLRQLISSPQWLFVYHLILLFSLTAMLGLVLAGRRGLAPADRRGMSLALGSMLILRLLPALLTSPLEALGLPAAVWLPPAERMVDTLSLVLVMWGFVLPFHRSRSARAPFLWAHVGLLVLALVGLTRLWAGEWAGGGMYALSWQRFFWAGWQILLCVCAVPLILGGSHPAGHRALLLAFFSILALGQILEGVFPLAGNAPAWTRGASILAYPVLAAAVSRMVISRTAAPSPAESLMASLARADSAESVLALFEDIERAPTTTDDAASVPLLEETFPPEEMAERMIQPIARALGIDQAAIGMLEGGLDDRMRLVAIYNPLRQGRSGELVSFPLDEQLSIRRALRRKEMVLVGGADDIVQLRFLYALMGSRETGPLMVYPLLYQGKAIGALILGNGTSKQPFTFVQTRLAAKLAWIAGQLLAGPKYVSLLRKALEERTATFKAREAEWGARLEALDMELGQERESARLFAQRLAQLERTEEEKERELDRVSRRLLLQEEEARRSQEEAAALNRKLESLAREKLRLEDEIRGYREQIRELERLLSENEGRRLES